MGACSSKPKTAEFEGNMNFYIQEELAGKNLDDEQKDDRDAGLKNLETEPKISSKWSLQNVQPAMEYNGKEADKQVKANMATSMIDELPCHIPNFTELHAKHSTSADEKSGVHETENPIIDLVNTKVEDDSMAWKSVNEASGMIPGEDGAQVGLKEGSQTSSLSKECNEAGCSIQGEDYASKQEHDLIFCPDEIEVLKVVDMTKEQVIDYERHSAAFQPLQTFEEPHVVEPSRSMYGRDMASDIDDMLEKLASEFVRQETLSSFLP